MSLQVLRCFSFFVFFFFGTPDPLYFYFFLFFLATVGLRHLTNISKKKSDERKIAVVFP